MNRLSDFSSVGDSNILTFEEGAEMDPASILDDPIFAPTTDEFEEQVAQAQEQLEELRRQQEEIEHQKVELEQLRHKQSEFQRGRVEMVENLQHALDMLERDSFDAERRVEQFARAKECFSAHLTNIAGLRPETWSREELRSELDHACTHVADAREDYQRTLAHLDSLAPEQPELPTFNPAAAPSLPAAEITPGLAPVADPVHSKDFSYWMRSGFAFTLPLMMFGVFALMLMLIFG